MKWQLASGPFNSTAMYRHQGQIHVSCWRAELALLCHEQLAGRHKHASVGGLEAQDGAGGNTQAAALCSSEDAERDVGSQMPPAWVFCKEAFGDKCTKITSVYQQRQEQRCHAM